MFYTYRHIDLVSHTHVYIYIYICRLYSKYLDLANTSKYPKQKWKSIKTPFLGVYTGKSGNIWIALKIWISKIYSSKSLGVLRIGPKRYSCLWGKQWFGVPSLEKRPIRTWGFCRIVLPCLALLWVRFFRYWPITNLAHETANWIIASWYCLI